MATKKVTDEKTAEKSTVKKAAVKTAETKTAETVKSKTAVKKPAERKTATKRTTAKKNTEVIIQSALGGEITPESIIDRVGAVDKVYIRVDQNKAYWVRGEESGSVDLW